MKRLAALALLLAAFGALIHFWPSGDPSSLAPSTRSTRPAGDPRAAATIIPPASQPQSPKQAPASAQTSAPAGAERPAAGPARIEIRAPQTVPPGETFSVTIEVQAPEEFGSSSSL